MIELTEDIVYEAMRRAKIDQDKIIKKAKEIEWTQDIQSRQSQE